MKSLKRLQKYLSSKSKILSQKDFKVPELWLSAFGKSDNFYDYVMEIIKKSIDKSTKNSIDYSKSYYSNHDIKDKNWIKYSFIYSMMIRFASSYDYNSDGVLEHGEETGTFLKSIAMIPYLSNMGIDTVYLLPIMKHSTRYKKGDAGSCYAISNFFELDSDLKDFFCEDLPVELLFKAFVEVAHSFGIKVVMDFIPRTNAVNSELIEKYPEWFYWIDINDLENYKAPFVPKIKKPCPAENKVLNKIFSSREVLKHIMKFKENPFDINPELFKKIRNEYANSKNKESDFLSLVEKYFSMTVAPAFSDVINDTQALWNDITYLRLFKDHPAESKKILEEKGLFPKPYILYDVAKASNCEGEKPNIELWNMLSDIIPYYQKNFGIDGARIDMGHALPEKLLEMIIQKALKQDKNFCFIAEELNPNNAKKANEQGYHSLVGDAFYKLNRLNEKGYADFVKTVSMQPIPIFSGPETHDTPRIFARKHGKHLSKSISLASFFIPNTIAFLNNGQELLEKQPMNLGLDSIPEDQFVLKKNDIYYSKLALFDYTALHWEKAVKSNLIDEIKFLINYRKKYVFNSFCKTMFLPVNGIDEMAIIHIYQTDKSSLICAINTDFQNNVIINIKENVLSESKLGKCIIQTVYSSRKKTRTNYIKRQNGGIFFKLGAGEFSLIEIKKLI